MKNWCTGFLKSDSNKHDSQKEWPQVVAVDLTNISMQIGQVISLNSLVYENGYLLLSKTKKGKY